MNLFRLNVDYTELWFALVKMRGVVTLLFT